VNRFRRNYEEVVKYWHSKQTHRIKKGGIGIPIPPLIIFSYFPDLAGRSCTSI
jgi:hypothetical protein